MSGSEPPAASVDEVLALFHDFARDPYDEEVSQLDHALQTAALAVAEGAGDELVAAALLHDVGHLLALRDDASLAEAPSGERSASAPDGDGVDLRHEARGVRWLASLFPPTVTGPIALHVAAKRYICAIDGGYEVLLSAGSRASLVRQGGPMEPDEVERFRAMPSHVDAVRLRRWDDAGKQTEGIEVAALAAYGPLLERVART